MRRASDRGQRALGVIASALLVASPIAATLLGTAGSASDWLAGPSAPSVTTVYNGTFPACGASGCRTTFPHSTLVYPDVAALAFVPAGNLWVAGIASGWITEVSASNRSVLSQTSTGCAVLSGYYPGSGPDVFFSCAGPNGTSALVFDWASRTFGAVRLSGPLGAECGAYSAGSGELFCLIGDQAPSGLRQWLVTVDLATSKVIHNVTISDGVYLPGMVWDPALGAVLLSTADGVNATAPSNGSVVRQFDLSGGPTSLAMDPTSTVLALTTDPPLGCDLIVLDGRSLARTATISYDPSKSCTGAYGAPFFDDRQGEVYVQVAGCGLVGINVTTHSATPGNACQTDPLGSYIYSRSAFDPRSETLAFGSTSSDTPDTATIALLNVSHGWVPAPAFSGVPLVGPRLPWAIGLGGVLMGVALVTVWVLRRPPTLSLEEGLRALHEE